ncbi:MAG TPA: nucleoside-diphosphate kinase [Planctomycetota bacterium]|nr:nucleoside-diphosphate kinase [Planctomycetota bacterium]
MPALERTLVLFKPDALQRRLAGRILARFEEKGLRIVGLKLMRMTPELAATHYEAHKAKPFYAGLVRFMTSSPIVALAVEGKDSVAIVRKMVGKTFGPEAEPGTIRGDFGASRSFNLIHASDAADTARREVELFFRAGELLDWKPTDLEWVYDVADELR